MNNYILFKRFLIAAACVLFSAALYASQSAQHESEMGKAQAMEQAVDVDITEVIFEHISDSHDWHILDWKGQPVSMPLPVILVNTKPSFSIHCFMSSEFQHGHADVTRGKFTYHLDENPKTGKQTIIYASHAEGGEVAPIDLSITKNVFTLLWVSILIFIVFRSCAKAYTRNPGKAPRGLQGFMEPIILFVRDDIALPNIGEKQYQRFLPYLLTVFFFIWFLNTIGLVPFFPGSANVTGNIAVTLVLAVGTFVVVNINGNKDYWRHIFAMPGLPLWLLPIMIIVELIGIVSKPFALMIRLFANITAGHIIVLSLIGLIFIAQSVFASPVSVVFVVFMDVLELFVAVLQAYIFTMLTALFIGLAVKEHEHEAAQA
ncbi:MAG: F0F1 ATP synthase subunit A [Bacteroidales bacterium]|jgi:F-type H+-transporting ATPase subunit a|nr:F0F1 ATP synthase subunit A [Bacteroidales bacterium]